MENPKQLIIYIRHGNDMKSKYRFDQKLTDKGKKRAQELSQKLIDQYGIPDAIFYSPYYRTRQTKNKMLKTISKHTDEKIFKRYDRRLSRFFTKKDSKNPDIRKDTKNKKVPIFETWKEFKNRVRKQLNYVEKRTEFNVIWCIGHTLILKEIIKIKNLPRSTHIEYLDTIVL